jgi:enoyl-CoA hydratase
MGAIKSDMTGGTLTLRLDRPPVNALDVATLDELSDRLDAASAEDVQAVVLTGSGPVFSAGADLHRVLDGGGDYVNTGIAALSLAFETLFVFFRPVIAAVNGHAWAGGCILTSACDYRIMSATGGTIGAVELKAGVPFPAWALEILRYAVNNEHVQETSIRAVRTRPMLR